MVRKRAYFLLVGLAVLAGPVAVAAPVHKHVQPRDYVARAPEEVDVAPVAEAARDARPDCFVSFTAVEATRGIRHWTGKCR